METFSIVARQDEKSFQLKDKVKKLLEGKYIYNEKDPDYCFAIGGDGTFLYAAHQYLEQLDKIKFIGIHTGTLGFFSDYKEDELEECMDDFMHKKGSIQEYGLLKGVTDTNKNFYAINEIRVEALARAQQIEVYINDEHFENFRGNGIMVCTQLGSTAYNRSIGGAIIDHPVECIEMMEIAGINHQLYPTCNSPIIFRKETTIKLKNKHYENVSLLYDQFEEKLTVEKEVTLSMSDKTLRILRFKDIPYLKRIKTLF
ncbi:MAG: NAD kinase [Erysipelotrichaceae bacterium]